MPTVNDLLTPLRRETDAARFTGKLSQLAAAQRDFVIPQSLISMAWTRTEPEGDGPIALSDPYFELTSPPGSPFLLDAGVYRELQARPTRTALRHVANRLGIPLAYLDKLMRHPEDLIRHLATRNINELSAVDERAALVRLWMAEDGWLLRAVLSDSYQAIDNFRVLGTLAEAIREVDVSLSDCEVDVDLTPDRFRMRIAVPQIELLVPDVLGDYRMPYSMREGAPAHAPAEPGEVPPVLWAGVEISNSETGGGAVTITPRAVVRICRNGLTRPIEFRRTHVGARLDEGGVNWSDATRQRALELVRSQMTDVFRAYCSTDYLMTVADEMRAAKGVTVTDAAAAVDTVARQFEFTEGEAENILACFLRGGDETALGLGQAVTAAAALVDDGDRQSEMESRFWQIVGAPATYATTS